MKLLSRDLKNYLILDIEVYFNNFLRYNSDVKICCVFSSLKNT